jgi:1,4-alpha-glucan branching enzyme
MPGLCKPINEGGIGFDFRLGMSYPDLWKDLTKYKKENEWDIDKIWNTLTNRRYYLIN